MRRPHGERANTDETRPLFRAAAQPLSPTFSLQFPPHAVYTLHAIAASSPGPGHTRHHDRQAAAPLGSPDLASRLVEAARLRAALDAADADALALREQHLRLVARSASARRAWESALGAKDEAIGRLEAALASRASEVEVERTRGRRRAAHRRCG